MIRTKKMTLKIAALLLALVALGGGGLSRADAAEKLVIKPLAKTRSKIFNFRNTGIESRKKILETSRNLFTYYYVNRELKKAIYGADPLARLDEIENNLVTLSESQFQMALALAYNSVHDVHTYYVLPKPYQCSLVYIPLKIERSDSGRYIVSAIDPSKVHGISIGDELVSYNGKSPAEIIRERAVWNSGGLPETILAEGLKDFTYRALGYSPIPNENAVELKLVHRAGGTTTVEVPWLTGTLNSCLVDAGFPKLRNLKPVSGPEAIVNDRPFDGAPAKVDLSQLNPSPYEPRILSKVIPFRGSKIGYLKLGTFEFDTGGSGGNNHSYTEDGPRDPFLAVSLFLQNELSQTDSLLIDLRGNGGGAIEVAEVIAALFIPNERLKAARFQIRANPYTLSEVGAESNWGSLISPWVSSNQVVGSEVLTAPNPGQSYRKRVVLLTDSECVSSCEIFAGLMKDLSDSTIYGTSHSTYGAGANFYGNSQISSLPIPEGMSIRVTFRGGLRLSDQSVIDDVGIPTDHFVAQTVAEIINPVSSSVVFQIFEDLAAQR